MRSAFLMLLAMLAATGCSTPRRRVVAPMPMLQAPPDPRLSEALARCEGERSASAGAVASARSDALAGLAAQRLSLLTQLETNRAQATVLSTRVLKARKSIRERAQSEYERALIAEALLDIDEGREPIAPLPARLKSREEFRDSVEARNLIRQNRDTRAKIEAQIAALDVVVTQMSAAAWPSSVLPPTPPGTR